MTLELASNELRTVLLPEKGCDIISLVHVRSGLDLLWKTPWGGGRVPPHAADSYEAWVRASPGGWQLLLPNGGAACVEHGVEWGFHGEAALVPWSVEEVSGRAAHLRTALTTAPLEVEREVVVDGTTLRIDERVINRGGSEIDLIWTHHPAFGAPFLEAGCTISAAARTLVADPVAPGGLLEPGARGAWPHQDLTRVPGPEEPRAVLAYLTDFDEPTYTISNPRLGLSVSLSWLADLFPHAWLWQEIHASPGFPWYRRAYVTAIEPSTTFPARGVTASREAGDQLLTLPAGAGRTARLEARLC